MKNTKFFAFGLSLLFSVCIQSQPVWAAQKESSIQIQDESSVMDLIPTLSKASLQDLKYTGKENGARVYENDLMRVQVEDLDLSQAGKQEVTLRYSLKNTKEVLDKFNTASPSVTSDYTVQKTIEVVDKIAPTIEAQDTYSITEGDEFNLEDLVQVSDDHSKDLDVEYNGDVDTSTPGTYTVEVVAKDAGGNQASKEITIDVAKKQDPQFYQKIAEAALAQIGVNQDCTMLVTNSLKAVGINFHGWPMEYASLGEWTNDPVPGDIIIYQGHVAIYIGNGQAVHGGWLGYTTVVSSVECTNALIGYIHVNQ